MSKPCPKCGRPMAEETMFRGLWTCPGYSQIVADATWGCDGFELTEAGAAAMVDEFMQEKQFKL